MKTRLIFLAISVLLATAVIVTSAGAITFGEPDENRHPNVGVIVADIEGNGNLSMWCSGTLISATAYLTAGHCTNFFSRLGPSRLWITFDTNADLETSALLPVDSIITHPAYNDKTVENDVGVIILSAPVEGVTPGELPPVNLLDQMKAEGMLKDQLFVNVGYGMSVDFKSNPPALTRDALRRFSRSPYSGLTPHWLHLLGNNDATGGGSICFGDSGGPQFLGDSNMIVSVTSLGDSVCRSLNLAQRIDTAEVLEFLYDYAMQP